MSNQGLEGRKDREFVLNMNFNLTVGNSVLNGSFNGDGAKWTAFNLFGWSFPIGTRILLRNMHAHIVFQGIGSVASIEVMKNNPITTLITVGLPVGAGDYNSALIDVEYEQVLTTDVIFPRLFKQIPVGPSGNISGTAQCYCEWIVHPSELL